MPTSITEDSESATTVCFAAEADLSELVSLENEFDGDRLSPRQMRWHLDNPRALFRVLRHHGVLQGYSLSLMRADSPQARLYSIAVSSAARGRGFGRMLLLDAMKHCRRLARSAISLEVRQDNVSAIQLYESLGFQRVGAYPAYYEDGCAAWRYRLSL